MVELKVGSGERENQCRAYRLGLEDDEELARVIRSVPASLRPEKSCPVLSYFLRRPERDGSTDHGGTVDIDWWQIEEALGIVERRARISEEARVAVRSFRSLLLTHSGSDVPRSTTIQRLRQLVDLPFSADRDPLRALLLYRDYSPKRKGDTLLFGSEK